MLYSAVRRVLFSLDPETAHRITLAALTGFDTIGLTGLVSPPPLNAPRRVMGIDVPNPVGLAAGFDKNAEHIDLMAALGFGFLEVGTVTPRPQPGNPPPRVFRIPEKEALINRLGFNNVGVDALLRNVERARFKGVLGINIGKNLDTPVDRAHEDYVACLRRVYPHATYVTVNDYEGKMLSDRTQLSLPELSRKVRALVVTHGAAGSQIHVDGKVVVTDESYRVVGSTPGEAAASPVFRLFLGRWSVSSRWSRRRCSRGRRGVASRDLAGLGCRTPLHVQHA
jgi:hypothetical protein